MPTPTQQLTAAVLAWPGTSVRIGERDEYAFDARGHELGHLHADRVAHFFFPRDLGTQLRDAGRVGPHPVNRHSPKLAARDIANQADVADVLALMRLNYDREVGSEADEVAVRAVIAELDAAQSDTERYLALLTADVMIVNVAGRRVSGRETLRAAMTHALEGDLAAVTTRLAVESVAFPAVDLAVVGATKVVTDGRAEPKALPARATCTHTLVRTPDGWRAAVIQTTPT